MTDAANVLAVVEGNEEERLRFYEQHAEEVIEEVVAEVAASLVREPLALVGVPDGATLDPAVVDESTQFRQVDLRSKLPGSPQPNQGTTRKTSVTFHWNGPQVKLSDIDQLFVDARYHRQKNWGTAQQPAWANGIQYEWAVGSDGTQYKLRNDGAVLWHCGHGDGNRESISVTFLIGQGQRITAAARASAKNLVDKLRAKWGFGANRVYGHLDWSSSECPGTAYGDFVVPYRQGRLGNLDPKGAVEVPFDMGKVAFLSAHKDHAPIARAAADALDEFAGQGFASHGGDTPGEILYATRRSAQAKFGELVSVLVGSHALLHVSPAVSVVGEPDETDIWSTYKVYPKLPTADAIEPFLREVANRRGLGADRVIASYRRRLGKASPGGAEPKTKPQKPGARTLLMVEDGFLGLAFGDASKFQGTHKGWDLWPKTQTARSRIFATNLAGRVIEVRDHGSVSGFTQALQVRFDNGYVAQIGHVKAGISRRWRVGDRFEPWTELCEIGSASDGKGIRHAHIELFTDQAAALRYDHSKALDPAKHRDKIVDTGPVLRVQGFGDGFGPLDGADETMLRDGLSLVDVPCYQSEPVEI